MATSYLSESVEVDRKSVIASAYSLRCEMSQVLLDIANGTLKLSDVLPVIFTLPAEVAEMLAFVTR